MNGENCRWLLASLLVFASALPANGNERAAVSLRQPLTSPETRRDTLESTPKLDDPSHRIVKSSTSLGNAKRSKSEPQKSKEPLWYEKDKSPAESPEWLGRAPRDALTQQLVGRTLLVTTAFAGIGLVVVALAHRVQIRRRSSQKTGSMALLDTLHLAPRCTLQLIRIDSQKFLVARDAGGVRSVTPVQSFAETIDQVTTGNPLEEAVAQNDHWDQGLSLETPYRNKDVSTPLRSRRIDSWQENSWNR